MLVFAPAHPRYPHRPDIVEYEVRSTVDGHLVLPVFSTLKRLVATLGPAQPWVELPLDSVERSVAVAPGVTVVVDPSMTQELWTWDANSLRAAMVRSGTSVEPEEPARVG